MDLLVGFHLHFARNGMLKHPIPYIGMGAQANLMVGSGEKRLSFRSSENASQTVVTLWLVEKFKRPLLARRNGPQGARYTDTTGGFPASCLRTATLMLIGAKTSRLLQGGVQAFVSLLVSVGVEVGTPLRLDWMWPPWDPVQNTGPYALCHVSSADCS